MANYSNLNPQTIGELTPKELRKTYSELRSIARKRMDRLEAAGFETQRRFAPLSQLDRDDLEPELARLAYFLQSPGSRLMTARKEREQITMAARGYNIEDYNRFGDFMDQIRYRFKNRKLDDSDPYVQIYDAAEKRNMTVKTLEREFGKYMNYAATAEMVRDALESAPMTSKNKGYLTAADLQKILNRRNIDDIYNREYAAEHGHEPAKRGKAKGKSGKKK